MLSHDAPLDLGLTLAFYGPAPGPLPRGASPTAAVRWTEVQRVRRAIAAGAYDRQEVWHVVLERLSQDLS